MEIYFKDNYYKEKELAGVFIILKWEIFTKDTGKIICKTVKESITFMEKDHIKASGKMVYLMDKVFFVPKNMTKKVHLDLHYQVVVLIMPHSL